MWLATNKDSRQHAHVGCGFRGSSSILLGLRASHRSLYPCIPAVINPSIRPFRPGSLHDDGIKGTFLMFKTRDGQAHLGGSADLKRQPSPKHGGGACDDPASPRD